MHETLIDYYYNSTGTTSYTQHLINHFAPQNWYDFEHCLELIRSLPTLPNYSSLNLGSLKT